MIPYLETRIEKEFAKNNIVNISDKNWNEILNYKMFLIKKDFEFLFDKDIQPNSESDENERKQIFDFFYEFDFSDIHTRQAVYQPKYENNDKLASCISCLQIVIRKKKLFLFVHQRSCNYDKNFWFDLQTFCFLAEMISEKYDCLNPEIEIRIVSLHKEIL